MRRVFLGDTYAAMQLNIGVGIGDGGLIGQVFGGIEMNGGVASSRGGPGGSGAGKKGC